MEVINVCDRCKTNIACTEKARVKCDGRNEIIIQKEDLKKLEENLLNERLFASYLVKEIRLGVCNCDDCPAESSCDNSEGNCLNRIFKACKTSADKMPIAKMLELDSKAREK